MKYQLSKASYNISNAKILQIILIAKKRNNILKKRHQNLLIDIFFFFVQSNILKCNSLATATIIDSSAIAEAHR